MSARALEEKRLDFACGWLRSHRVTETLRDSGDPGSRSCEKIRTNEHGRRLQVRRRALCGEDGAQPQIRLISDQQAEQNWTVFAAADKAPTKPRRRTAVAEAQLEGDRWLTHDIQLDRRVAEAHGQLVDVDLQRHRNVE